MLPDPHCPRPLSTHARGVASPTLVQTSRLAEILPDASTDVSPDASADVSPNTSADILLDANANVSPRLARRGSRSRYGPGAPIKIGVGLGERQGGKNVGGVGWAGRDGQDGRMNRAAGRDARMERKKRLTASPSSATRPDTNVRSGTTIGTAQRLHVSTHCRRHRPTNE